MLEILPGETDVNEISKALAPLLRGINKPCECETGEPEPECAYPLVRAYYNDVILRGRAA